MIKNKWYKVEQLYEWITTKISNAHLKYSI